jgi:EmrB/QacA subfamily drug resistance transporter
MSVVPSPKRAVSIWWVLALTSVASLVVALDQLVVATALQKIRLDLHASMSSLEWTVNAFSLSLATLLIPSAQLGDRIGRKRTLIIGLLLFALSSAVCALSPNMGLLLGARAVQGAGGAMILPSALALLTGALPALKRGLVMGIFAAVSGLAVVCGPLIGGAVAEGFNWHWVFWINIPLIAVILPFVAIMLREAKGQPAGTDFLGTVLLGASIFGLVWGLVHSGTAGWDSGEVLGSLGVGGVLLALFVVWELRAGEPLLPIRLFALPAFGAGNLSTLLLTASLFSTVFFLAQYLQIVLRYSPLDAGLRFLPWAVPMFFVSPITGRLQDRIGPRWLISVGLALHGVGLLWLAETAVAHTSYLSGAFGALVVSGVGLAMAMPAQQNGVMSSIPPALMGKAAGTFSTIRQMGGALGVAILAAVFSANGSDQSPSAFARGFAAAISAAAVMAFLGAVSGLFTPGRRAKPTASTRPIMATAEELDAV